MTFWQKLFKAQAPEVEPERPQSIFSTHLDPLVKRERTNLWGDVMDRLRASLPRLSLAGTGMDDDETNSQGLNLNSSQPNISDTLLMWYGSQTFIGAPMCAILAQHWLIEKACSMPARDAIRQGFEIVSLDNEPLDPAILFAIKQADKRLGLTKALLEFVRMGRIFGIRIAIFVVESPDPDYYEKPFNVDGVRQGAYKGIVQVDPYWVSPMLDGEAAADPASKHFYEPTWWMVNGKKYHRSHLAIFRHAEVPDMLKPAYIYGGVPVPQQIMERVYAADRTANEGPLLAMTKRTTVFSTNIAQAYANKTKFDAQMIAWVTMRDNQQIKIADKEADAIQQFDTTLTGLDEIIMTQYQIVAAAAQVPATKLLGTTPKGFNATGEFEEASYHEYLESLQTHDMTPLVDRHHQLIIKSEIKPKFGTAPSVTVEWNPLDSPTAAEEANINLTKAQAGVQLVQSGAIDGIDERNRIRADPHSGYTGIEEVAADETTGETEA